MADILAKGVLALTFTLNVTPDQTLSLSEFAGRRVILAFYPSDWSPVCGDQMTLYNHILPEFRKRGAELLGISVDGAWCHLGLRSRAQAALWAWFITCHFQVTPEVGRAVMIKGLLVLGVTLI